MSHLVTKPTKWHVRPAKTQISLGIRPVWSESSLCAQWVAKDPSFLHADSEDTDQTGRMPRLIWVFAGRTTILLVLSRGGSIIIYTARQLFAGIYCFHIVHRYFRPSVRSWRFGYFLIYWKVGSDGNSSAFANTLILTIYTFMIEK